MVDFTFNGVTYSTDDFEKDDNRGYSEKIVPGIGGSSVYRFVACMLDAIADMARQGIVASTSSNSIGTGSKVFALLSPITIPVGAWYMMVDNAAPTTNYQLGQVTASSVGSVTISVPDSAHFVGSGTKTDWTLTPSGLLGSTGATGSIATAADGSVSSPPFRFTSATNTGMYRTATELAFAWNGVKELGISATQVVMYQELVLGGQLTCGGNIIHQGRLRDTRETVVDLGTVSSGTATINFANGDVYKVTIGGNMTFALSNVPSSGTGKYGQLILTNAGAHTITWFANINWDGGSVPLFSTSGRDRLLIATESGTSQIDVGLIGFNYS